MTGLAALVIEVSVVRHTMGSEAQHMTGSEGLVIEASVARHTMGSAAAPARLSACVKSSIDSSNRDRIFHETPR